MKKKYFFTAFFVVSILLAVISGNSMFEKRESGMLLENIEALTDNENLNIPSDDSTPYSYNGYTCQGQSIYKDRGATVGQISTWVHLGAGMDDLLLTTVLECWATGAGQGKKNATNSTIVVETKNMGEYPCDPSRHA